KEAFSLPIWEGALGLLVSPGRSLFLYAPPVLLGLALWPRFARHFAAEALLIAAIGAGHPLVYGRWYSWWAGLSWGPRFLLPALPFLLLPLALLPARRAWRLVAGALVVAGLLVNAVALLVSFTELPEPARSDAPLLWSPTENAFLAQVGMIGRAPV